MGTQTERVNSIFAYPYFLFSVFSELYLSSVSALSSSSIHFHQKFFTLTRLTSCSFVFSCLLGLTKATKPTKLLLVLFCAHCLKSSSLMCILCLDVEFDFYSAISQDDSEYTLFDFWFLSYMLLFSPYC